MDLVDVRLEIATRQDGDQWIAWCLPLDVASQGSNEADAVASLKEAAGLWIESCMSRGVLEGALREVRAQGLAAGKGYVRSSIEIAVPAPAAEHLLTETSAPR